MKVAQQEYSSHESYAEQLVKPSYIARAGCQIWIHLMACLGGKHKHLPHGTQLGPVTGCICYTNMGNGSKSKSWDPNLSPKSEKVASDSLAGSETPGKKANHFGRPWSLPKDPLKKGP